jgi:RNA polymerase sigma-70 factor (ECF subfamily)
MKGSAIAEELRAPMDESEAIAGTRRGDLAAFEELYRMHAARVHALSLRLSGDPQRAEEITQDVFVRLWNRIGTFEGRSTLASWLHRLTVNRVLDRVRAERRRGLWESDDSGWDKVPDPTSPDPAGSDPADLRRTLEVAIQGLPAGARLVFVLHDVEGYRHEEISSLVGIAAGTSKAQLHRARRLLREQMERREGRP